MKLIIVPVVAVLGIVTIEVFALYMGINGGVMSISVAAIAGIGGYTVKGYRDRAKKPK